MYSNSQITTIFNLASYVSCHPSPFDDKLLPYAEREISLETAKDSLLILLDTLNSRYSIFKWLFLEPALKRALQKFSIFLG